jgi:hypothetical protein
MALGLLVCVSTSILHKGDQHVAKAVAAKLGNSVNAAGPSQWCSCNGGGMAKPCGHTSMAPALAWKEGYGVWQWRMTACQAGLGGAAQCQLHARARPCALFYSAGVRMWSTRRTLLPQSMPLCIPCWVVPVACSAQGALTMLHLHSRMKTRPCVSAHNAAPPARLHTSACSRPATNLHSSAHHRPTSKTSTPEAHLQVVNHDAAAGGHGGGRRRAAAVAAACCRAGIRNAGKRVDAVPAAAEGTVGRV